MTSPDTGGRHYTHWTEADDDYLRTYWGTFTDQAVADHLQRTVGACVQRAVVLGISRKLNMFSLQEVANLLGLTPREVRMCIVLGALRGRRASFGPAERQYWRIEAEDLETFMQTYPQVYNYRRIDRDEYPYWYNLGRQVQQRKKTG